MYGPVVAIHPLKDPSRSGVNASEYFPYFEENILWYEKENIYKKVETFYNTVVHLERPP